MNIMYFVDLFHKLQNKTFISNINFISNILIFRVSLYNYVIKLIICINHFIPLVSLKPKLILNKFMEKKVIVFDM